MRYKYVQNWEESDQSIVKSFYTLLCSGFAAVKQLHLTACAFRRVLRLAQTIADLDNTDIIKANHLAEVLQ